MFITIDFESEIPIYSQLKNEIIKSIAKGELREGDELPSVRQLAEDIGINMHTVNKSYNILKQEGFINIDRRKGAVINLKNLKTKETIIEELSIELEPIVATATCSNITKEEFIEVIKKLYVNYGEER